MAKEKQVWEVIKNAGYNPLADKCIIVSYAPVNLSDRIMKFFSNRFYVFQMCEEQLVLVPFSEWTYSLKKDVTLEILYKSIISLNVEENGLNYFITVKTDDDEIVLSTQQKELSDWRTAGSLAGGIDFDDNWHKDNLDGTLKSLQNLNI